MLRIAAILGLTFVGCGGAKPTENVVALPTVSARPPPAPIVVSDDVVLASDVVEHAINPAKLPLYSGPSGIVEGTVVMNGAPVGNALMGITGYAGFVVKDEHSETVVTERASFEPSVVILTYGQALVVENDTSQARHPMFEQQPHTLAVPSGASIRLHPKSLGRYRLVDGSWSADVFVAATPLHATTDARGHFRIARVPIGNLTVHAAHAAHQSESPIEVKDNAVTTVTLTLP